MYDFTPPLVPDYEYVTDPCRVLEVADLVAESPHSHALDFETTGLYVGAGKVRLTAICGAAGNFVIDHFKSGVAFASIALRLTDGEPFLVFNAGFEGRWFDAAPNTYGKVKLYDVGVMSKAKLGGRPLSLRQQVARDLDIELDKDQQLSDWSAPDLTKEQLDYSFADAYYTFKLGDKWVAELDDAQWRGFLVMNDVWRANAEMEDTGFHIDVEHHKKLIKLWTLRAETAERVLRKYTPPDLIPNLQSPSQIGAFIASVLDAQSEAAWPKTGKKEQLKIDKFILRRASARSVYPFSRWLAALLVFNRANKYLGTYGQKLLTLQELSSDGMVHCRLNIAQAVTGRYSSSSPNLQNIPRAPLVRKSFIAPEGATLILADYSGIELRVLAEMSGDEQLKQDVIFGNVHAESAITLYRLDRDFYMAKLKAGDAKAKSLRSTAKAFSFQLTYGAGIAALAIVLRCSDAEAAEFVQRWAARYPKAYAFRQYMFEKMNMTGFLPCQSGRTIYVRKPDRTLPVASNYPIQGSAGDVMYRAIQRTHDAMLARPDYMRFTNARMCLTVHDELIIQVIDEPELVDYWKPKLEECMKAAWLDIFPGTSTNNLVEAGVGKSWAAK